MSDRIVRVGDYILNLSAIASVHWEQGKKGRTLFVHLDGGRFLSFTAEAAELVWSAYGEGAVDLAELRNRNGG